MGALAQRLPPRLSLVGARAPAAHPGSRRDYDNLGQLAPAALDDRGCGCGRQIQDRERRGLACGVLSKSSGMGPFDAPSHTLANTERSARRRSVGTKALILDSSSSGHAETRLRIYVFTPITMLWGSRPTRHGAAVSGLETLRRICAAISFTRKCHRVPARRTP